MKITVELNKKSIDKAIKDIEKYTKSIDDKIKQLLTSLAEIGIDTAKVTYSQGIVLHQNDLPKVQESPIWVDDNHLQIQASGESILFIEFGAGIYYNTPVGTSPHPKGAELGYTIGGYGKGKGAKKGWYYPIGNDSYQFTHGTPSVPAMYEASKVMRQQITEKAKEIFYSD